METELANHLLTLSERFCAARELGETTVGRLCAADGRFFSRIREGKTFTAKKYDEVVGWFSSNWPDKAEWPHAVSRPVSGVAA
jgi:hypothetical protein